MIAPFRTVRIYLFAIFLLGLLPTAQAYPARGGSNLYYYHSAPAGETNGYGLLTDFYLKFDNQNVSDIIYGPGTGIIQQLLNNGQRSLSIFLFYGDNPDHNGTCPNSSDPSAAPAGSGGIVDSSSGSIPPNCLAALNSIISQAYVQGFTSVRIRFGIARPVNDPIHWASFDPNNPPEAANHNWGFIQSVVDGVTSGVDKYDLQNEELDNFGIFPQYDNWLWTKWVERYGSQSNTVGFSIPCDDNCTDKLQLIASVYTVNGTLALPPVFDLHIYGSQCPGQGTTQTAYQQFTTAANYLLSIGMGSIGWIIGETCNNDPTTAQWLQQAMNDTGHLVYSIQQWFPPNGCGVPGGADCELPYSYNWWIQAGF